MSKSEIHIQLGKAIASQGNGPAYSVRLEKRIATLKKLLGKS